MSPILYLEGAGKHSKLGELIGRAVKAAVKQALDRQTGLNPVSQHNALRRVQRFGVDKTTLWKKYLENCKRRNGELRKAETQSSESTDTTKAKATVNKLLKPEFLTRVEALAKEETMVTYTSLYVHLLDQFLWGLLQEEETKTAAETLLRVLAEAYNREMMAIKEPLSPEAMMAAWQNLFLDILT